MSSLTQIKKKLTWNQGLGVWGVRHGQRTPNNQSSVSKENRTLLMWGQNYDNYYCPIRSV